MTRDHDDRPEVARHAPVKQLNDRHGPEVLAVARAFGGVGAVTAARATAIDNDGVMLAVAIDDGREVIIRVPFAEPTKDARRRLAFLTLADQTADVLGATGQGAA